MRKDRYSDEQVITNLREQEVRRPTAEICRKSGVSKATFFKLKSMFVGMQVSESFNDRLRDECQNETLFSNMRAAPRIIEDQRIDYDEKRPHASPSRVTLNEFASWSREDHCQNGG